MREYFDPELNDYVVHVSDMISPTDVVAKENYTLLVTFNTGEKKMYDMKPLLQFPIFKALENVVLFRQAHVDHGTVIWNDDIDIAPEELYKAGVPFVGDESGA